MHIILRNGSEIAKNELEVKEKHSCFSHFQVSLNSWEHIVLRGFNYQYIPNAESDGIEDIVIILNKDETKKLIDFIRDKIM